jgi:preprotein translocase subunit SecG
MKDEVKQVFKKMDERVGPTSPLPALLQFKRFVFGKENPTWVTKLIFYINLPFVLYFLFWHVISFIAFSMRSLIFEHKGVDVKQIIMSRAEEIGLSSYHIIQRITTFHGVCMLIWCITLISLVFLWREKKLGVFLMLGTISAYLSMMVFYIGYPFLEEATTTYDRIFLLVMIVLVLFAKSAKKLDHSESDEILPESEEK